MTWRNGLDLLADKEAKTLIMGTFPGRESCRNGEYYFSKTNDFWRILTSVYSKDFLNMDYQDKVSNLFELGIGLWDVYSACINFKSMDKDIEGFVESDWSSLKKKCPALEKVCLNGKMASYYEKDFVGLGYNVSTLLSTSGANRSHEKKRLSDWKIALLD